VRAGSEAIMRNPDPDAHVAASYADRNGDSHT
jgi:hypothetical protein